MRSEMPFWEREQFEADVDLQGCEMMAAVVPWSPFIILDNQTLVDGLPVEQPYTRGFEVQLLETLAQSMNFRIAYRLPKPDNLIGQIHDVLTRRADIFIGCISYMHLYHDLMDATVAYQRETYRWFVPAPAEVPRWKSILMQFEPELWLSVAIALIAATATIAFLKGPFRDLSVWTWSAYHMLVQLMGGAAPTPALRAVNAFLTCWLPGCLVLGAAYKSSLVGFLADPGREPPVRDLDEWLESGRHLGVLASISNFVKTMDDTDPRYAKVAERYENCTHLPQCLDRVAFERDSAVPAAESRVQYDTPRNYTSPVDGRALLYPLPEPIVTTNIGMYFRRGSTLRHRVDTLLMRLLQAGFPDRWWRDLALEPILEPSRHFGYTPPSQILELRHLQGAFALLGAGLITSLVALMVELLVKSPQHRHSTSVQHRSRRFRIHALRLRRPVF